MNLSTTTIDSPVNIKAAQSNLDKLQLWFDQKVKPLSTVYQQEYRTWVKELDSIRDQLRKTGSIRVALIGSTGAGKSTFLNAILGQQVLPVGVMEPCTAFVTLVRYKADGGYTIAVDFATEKDWQSEIDAFIATSAPGESEDETSRHIVNAYRKKMEALYGIKIDREATPDAIRELAIPAEALEVLRSGGRKKWKFDDAKPMVEHLRKLVRGESLLWPLVKQVTISGPYDCLQGGVELVDLPGLNDPNEARIEVTREFLRSSPFVWLVFPMVRGLTKDLREVLVGEKLLRTLILGGTYNALSLVGTKADDIDLDSASQFGLDPESCTQAELIQAFREQTVVKAREQLQDFVRDLAHEGDPPDTLERMVDLAANAKVHAVSSSAYNRLNNIIRSSKDYGIADSVATGIPDIHDHLRRIVHEVGEGLVARTSITRTLQLRDEVAFFFRAKASSNSSSVARTRQALETEIHNLETRLEKAGTYAKAQLEASRDKFLSRIKPLAQASAQSLQRTFENWRNIHWATLRALMHRDGVFKSPSSGKVFDLNADLTEPLMKHLPLSWEQYFTDDLGRARSDYVLRITEAGSDFGDRVQIIVGQLGVAPDGMLKRQLKWFEEKVTLLAQRCTHTLQEQVGERRRELASKITLVSRDALKPAFAAARLEAGPGMKARMLERIIPAAGKAAPVIFSTIQADLTDGTAGLESVFLRLLDDLLQVTLEQARTVANNATIDLDEAAVPPEVRDLLDCVPQL
jgi:hypothetical protein